MLPKISVYRRYIVLGCVIVAAFFGQQTLDKVINIVNALTVSVMPIA